MRKLIERHARLRPGISFSEASEQSFLLETVHTRQKIN
jgi:hypothetical protein